MLWHRLYEHPNVANVDLANSYVLGWRQNSATLFLDLDAILLPDHPRYRAPAANEWACFEHYALMFSDVRELKGYAELDRSRPATDATGEADFGHIEEAAYTRLGQYRLIIELAGPLSFSASQVALVVSDV